MKTSHTIICCDTGIDDTSAFVLALQSEQIEIDLVVCSIGNNSVDVSTKNTQHVLSKMHASLPIVSGEKKPLYREPVKVDAHGKSGLGNYTYTHVADTIIKTKGYEAIKNILIAKKKVKILCLSPMTDIAKFLLEYPEYKKYIQEIIFMGGQKDDAPNSLPYKEFNVSVDPEAVKIVIDSKIPLTIVPMDLGHMCYLTKDEIRAVGRINEVGKMLEKMYDGYKDYHVKDGAAMHDVCCVCYLTNPDLIKYEKAYVRIEYFKEYGTGCLICDFNSKKTNAKVCVDINIDKFKKLYFDCLKKF